MHNGQFDESKLNYFLELMEQIKVLVRNEELYQLLLLISLLDTDCLGHGGILSCVVNLRQTYLRLYQRKYCQDSQGPMQ